MNAQPMCDRPIVRPPMALGIAPTERTHSPAFVARVVGKKRVAQPARPRDPDERDDHGPVERGKTAGFATVTHQTDIFDPFVREQVAKALRERGGNLGNVE